MEHYSKPFTNLKNLRSVLAFSFLLNTMFANEKVYALLCVACGWENSVYTVLCWCGGLCVRQFYFINF